MSRYAFRSIHVWVQILAEHGLLMQARAVYFGGGADWPSLVGGTMPFSRK